VAQAAPADTYLPQFHISDLPIHDVLETPPVWAIHLQRDILHDVPPLVKFSEHSVTCNQCLTPTCCPWESTHPQRGSLEPSNVTLEPPVNVNLVSAGVRLLFADKGQHEPVSSETLHKNWVFNTLDTFGEEQWNILRTRRSLANAKAKYQ